jgi:MYXO-CTERM domain-containing protein
MNRLIALLQLTVAVAVVLTITVQANAALIIDPATTTVLAEINETANQDASDIQTLLEGEPYNIAFGDAVLESCYKQNVGDTEDSGSFADDYMTTFKDTASEPTAADIEYQDTGNFISADFVYLVVKDGNNGDPPQYVFDLNALGWNGTETLQLQNFWAGEGVQGSISHVEIFCADDGGPGPQEIPEPASLAAWGLLSLVGVGGVLRRRRAKKS